EPTIDLPAEVPAEALRRQFEAAWREAVAGAERPRIEAYLSRASEAERVTLRGELQRLEGGPERRGISPGPTEVIPGGAGLSDPERPVPEGPPGAARPQLPDPTVELSHLPGGGPQTLTLSGAEGAATREFPPGAAAPAPEAAPSGAAPHLFVAGY